jgi:nitronate monooxygenase
MRVLDADFAVLEKYRVPIVITSLRAPNEYVGRIHAWGGRVFHDVTNLRHAEKAIAAGVDGLILVCAGAGGHSGALSPMALVSEVRRIYAGPLVVSGSITRGEHILAALAMGGDLAYIGTRFIASREANAVPEYKQLIVDSGAATSSTRLTSPGRTATISSRRSDAPGSIPDHLVREPGEQSKMVFTTADGSRSVGAKTWKDIWSAGHGVGSITDVPSVDELVARLRREFESARAQLVREPWSTVNAAASQVTRTAGSAEMTSPEPDRARSRSAAEARHRRRADAEQPCEAQCLQRTDARDPVYAPARARTQR